MLNKKKIVIEIFSVRIRKNIDDFRHEIKDKRKPCCSFLLEMQEGNARERTL